jgi:hypothetical protein
MRRSAALLERDLRQADQHVADGRGIIAQQLRIIAEFEVQGRDTGRALALLKTYLDVQKLLEEHRHRLSDELVLRSAKRVLLH